MTVYLRTAFQFFIILALTTILTGCFGKNPPKESPFSVGLRTYKGQYLTFKYPSSATMQVISNKESYVLGPQVSIVPTSPISSPSENRKQGDFKYAYQMHIEVHDNPMKLTADVWARDHIIHEWKRTQGGPSIYPVSQDGHILEDYVSMVYVGKEKAFMVDLYGYDYNTRSLFLTKDNVIIELSFMIFPQDKEPLAVVQKDIYALILGTMEFIK
jgi:hypothetical protein